MTRKHKIALLCFALTNPIFVGLVYLFSPRFLPYHQAAIGTPWEQLAPELQTLLLALLRAVGAGGLSSGIAMAVLVFRLFWRGDAWARRPLLIVGLAWYVPLLYATLLVRLNTPGNPPWRGTIALLVLLVAGFVLARDVRVRADSDEPQTAARDLGRTEKAP